MPSSSRAVTSAATNYGPSRIEASQPAKGTRVKAKEKKRVDQTAFTWLFWLFDRHTSNGCRGPCPFEGFFSDPAAADGFGPIKSERGANQTRALTLHPTQHNQQADRAAGPTMLLDTTRFEVHVTPCFYSIDPVTAASSSSPSSSSSGGAMADPPQAAPAAASEEVMWVNVPCPYTREIVVHAIARSVPHGLSRQRRCDAHGKAFAR